MAFVDPILAETEASVVMVDRRAVPGGHWNDAYPFVRLHQPAASYGVTSKPLGRNRIEASGLNAGLHELSSGVEIIKYYHDLMEEVFLASGRVTYRPLTEYVGDGEVVALLSGTSQIIEYQTLVDATLLTTAIPSTHQPNFDVGPGVTCVPPNRLPHLAAQYRRITVLGGGKTGVDALTWLLSNGYPGEALSWVVPRDAWFFNRASFEVGIDFLEATFGSLADEYEAIASASNIEDLCLEIEQSGRWLRVDHDVWPTMFHAATISQRELETLRRVGNIHREGRVQRLEVGEMVLDNATVPTATDILYVDCTASALAHNVGDRSPVFSPGRINLQMVRQFQPCFSSALIGFIEANIDDEAARGHMTAPTPMTDTVEDCLQGRINGIHNQSSWGSNKAVAQWMGRCRLDPGNVLHQIPRGDTAKMAILGRLLEAIPPALDNLPRLLANR
ncbi:MAG: NAD(P)/FAD-dependent oxidoreductase [Acidimicrobiia bacterium]|nr:NAD(P)/FAD-dependent oxidoreductase [Acidimicrobiia bacterium]